MLLCAPVIFINFRSPHTFSKQSFQHSYEHSHTSTTHPSSPAFKQAQVTPLLKKPTLNTSLIENYRPISLIPFKTKTLKLVVFNQVSWFLSQNNKLDANQSGFRSGRSTETEDEESKNRSLRNPGDQLMFCGYLPSPGHLERPTSEIGFKPAKWNPSHSRVDRRI